MITQFPILAALVFSFIATSAQAQKLDWFSVQDSEVTASQCIKLQAPNKNEMLEFLLAFQRDPEDQVSEKVGPFQFVNESPEYINLFKTMHTSGYRDFDVSWLKAGRKCKSVLCVLEQNYGTREALQMLYIQARFGFPTSPLAGSDPDNYQKWKSQELEVLIMGLESLPPQFFPIRNHHLLRFLEGYTRAMYGENGKHVMANATIEFFDLWAQRTKLQRLSVLVHELGHIVGMQNHLDQSKEWVALTDKNHISLYAQQNVAENFAESFTAYRFAPKKLKRIAPEKYEFMKEKVYNGLEFTSAKSCEQTYSEFQNKIAQSNHQYRSLITWSKSNQNTVKEELNRIKDSAPFEKRAYARCLSAYLKEVEKREEREGTIACIKKVFIERAVEIELIDQGLDAQRPIARRFQDIEISRYYLNNVRLQMRPLVAEAFDKAYIDGWFEFYQEPDQIRSKVSRMNERDSLLFSDENKAASAQILQKAIELKKKTKLRRYLGLRPDFEAVLP